MSRLARPRVSYVRADDGVRLALHRMGPDTGVPVLLVPGTFSNHTFWFGTRGTGFARTLAEHGFEAWALDPRGHGESQRPDRGGRRWDFDDWARRDLPAALAAIHAEGRSPFLVGHSAGGASALAAVAADRALQDGVRGVVTLGTPVPWLQPTRGLLSQGLRFVARRLERFPARALGLGPEDELPGVMAQWMTWNIEGRWRGDDGTDYGRELAHLAVPVACFAGAGDHLYAPPRACKALFDLISTGDRHFELCGRKTGYSRNFGHVDLVVSKAARQEVWPRLVEWMAERAG